MTDRSPPVREGRWGTRILGGLGILMLGLALLLLAYGGPAEVDLAEVDAPPLTLIDPADGAVVAGPLEVVFDPGVPIRPGPRGWGAGPLHLHLEMNRREYMPGPRDVAPLADGRYRWSLPPFSPGTYRIRLLWATEQHGSIPEGASGSVTIRVVEDDG